MDEIDNMGPILLPEDEAKLALQQAKSEKKYHRLSWFMGNRKKIAYVLVGIFVALILTALFIKVKNTILAPSGGTSSKAIVLSKDAQVTQSKTIAGLQLSPYKKFGNKYANGILPVGDKKFVTDKPQKGYVYTCNANFAAEGQAGAQVRGPWFINNSTQWDANKKPTVSGNVDWTQRINVISGDGKRTITTNDFPNHHTGIFPVSGNDPVKKYDANPNRISEQNLNYELNAGPGQGTPNCISGEVGIMLTGVPLFDAFDAGGRDAGAWEVQDSCEGHPQISGEYHYHTLSRCITDQSIKTIIGYALDGFAITGPKIDDNNILTTDDLDDCHGIVSEIMQEGKKTTVYHYVMTQDFPYSVSCFKGKPITPPGQHEQAPKRP